MSTATMTKRPNPPTPEARKDKPINAEFEDRAKDLLREAMRDQGMTVKELHERLTALGVDISAGGMANKISRGGFSAAFMLQCMEAMGIDFAIHRKAKIHLD